MPGNQWMGRIVRVGGAALGSLSAFYFYTYAAIQLPVGMLTDRFAWQGSQWRLHREAYRAAARRVRNYLATLTLEAQTLARACGKSHLLNLEPEDMVALTVEAAAMAGIPLAGTDWIPGRGV